MPSNWFFNSFGLSSAIRRLRNFFSVDALLGAKEEEEPKGGGEMAGFLVMLLLPFLFSIVLNLSKITTVSPHLVDSQRVCRDQTTTNGVLMICEVEEMKLKIARLESVLDESIKSLNTKLYSLKEKEKLIEEMDAKIHVLQTAVINIKNSSTYASEERVKALEEEVRLLWDASRKNNFDLHILESKVRDTEIKLEAVTSKVETIASIVTEQWIQIRQLDQALQVTEVRILKAQRKAGITRCTFLKFIKEFYGSHLAKVIEVLDQRFLRKDSSSYASKALYQVKRIMSAAQRYHHELQGFVKQEMEKHEFTAALANQEVVFFLASALITFPVLSAWMVLLSQFS